MIVCSCNVLSDAQVRDATDVDGQAPRTAGRLYQCLGCSAQCGRCARTIRKILADACLARCAGCPVGPAVALDEEETDTPPAPAVAAEA
jgi:bacterioferritin-associated ferredoxin